MQPYHILSFATFLTIIVHKKLVTGSEVLRPRGVSLSRVALYSPEGNFTCFDNSKSIPFNQVNDDYCDCPDSSDEPGTAACPNGVFYCTNKGHRPFNIPSSIVNDGICDCCDGTDEYSGLVQCVNNCLELGKQAREHAVKKAELYKAGKQLRAELVQLGQQMKNERLEKVKKLQENKNEAEKIKKEKEYLKNQAEDAENKALGYYRELEQEYKKKKAEREAEKSKEQAVEEFNKLDSNQNGYVEVDEIQVRGSFDRDRNGEVSIEEAKIFLNNEDLVDLETFLEKSWPLMKPFLQMDASHFKSVSERPSEADDMQHDEEQDEEGVENDDQDRVEDEDDDDKEEGPHGEQQEDDEKIEYDDETQKLVDLATEARNQYNEAEKNFRDIESEIRDLESNINTDFGPENEFAYMVGQCYDYDDREYTYRLCPFDKTLQIPKSSSAETRLGKWSKWSGSESNRYESMMYSDGQACWNGPNRSTKVTVTCGIENKVISVSEPHRCEYFFEFSTPAACGGDNEEAADDVHDEL